MIIVHVGRFWNDLIVLIVGTALAGSETDGTFV